MLISEEYRDQLSQLHANKQNFGAGTSGQLKPVVVMYLRAAHKADTVLDYGCGKGEFALKVPFDVTNYDPALKAYCKSPEPHDLVVCADVLEHIEPDCLDAVLDDLKRVTKKVGLFIISLGPAMKKLPDGRNAHICLLPPDDWITKLTERFVVEDVEFTDADGMPKYWMHVVVTPR